MWGQTFFDRVNIPNPYFQTIEEIVEDKEIIAQTFNLWIDVSDEEKKLKLINYYKNRNANYVFSYLSLMEDFLIDIIYRYNFELSRRVINTIINIDSQLLKSGFLISQKQNLRDETKFTIEGKILKYSQWLSFIIRIQEMGIDAILENAITMLKSRKELDDEINYNIFLISFILNRLPPDDINVIRLEKLCNLLLKKYFFINEGPFKNLKYALDSRRKYVRKKLFSGLKFQPPEFFERNPILAHFIYLKNLDYIFCKHYKDLLQAFLEKGGILYHKALYTTNMNLKVKFIEQSLELLKELNISNEDFDDIDSFQNWSINYNNIIGRDYELLYTLKKDEENSLEYLVAARDHYRIAKSKRGFLIEYYIQYLSLINLIQETTPEKIENVMGNISIIHQRVLDDFHFAKLFPLIHYLNQFYELIALIGKKDHSPESTLINYIHSTSTEPIGFPSIQRLARIILANNLLIDLLGDAFPFWNRIQEFLKIGEFTLPIEILPPDEEVEEMLDHPIFLEESGGIEFKGSIAFDVKRFIHTGKFELSDEVRDSFLRTVVGMLNCGGGEIYIGVLEEDKFNHEKKMDRFHELNPETKYNRIIIGIDKELEYFNRSSDEHIRHISSLLRKRIDANVMQNINMNVEKILNKNIYHLKINESEKESGCFLDEVKFYVRENNETISYTHENAIKFIINKAKKRV